MSQQYNWFQPTPAPTVYQPSPTQPSPTQPSQTLYQPSQPTPTLYQPSQPTPTVYQPTPTVYQSDMKRNNCWSLERRYQNALNQPLEFMFQDNSFYVGQTYVYPNQYLSSGAQYSDNLSIRNKNKVQGLSSFCSLLTPDQQLDRYYQIKSNFQDTLMGKKYERTTTQGHGWVLLMVNRRQTSNELTEIYEGEGVTEYLPQRTGIVQLRLERSGITDKSQVTQSVFYKYCSDNSNQWTPLSRSTYYFACPSV